MSKFLKSMLSVVAVALTSWTWAAEVYENPLAGDISYTFLGKTYKATKFTTLTALTENDELGNFDRVIYKVGGDNDTQTHTFAMRVKLESLSDDQILWWVHGGHNGDHSGYAVKAMADGGIRVGKTNTNGAWNGSNYYTSTTKGLVKAGVWTHVALAVTKTAGARTATSTLYVNGVKIQDFGGFATNLNGGGGSATVASVGANVTASNVYVDDTALDADAIRNLYDTSHDFYPTFWASFDNETLNSDKVVGSGSISTSAGYVPVLFGGKAFSLAGDYYGTQTFLSTTPSAFTLSLNAKTGSVANGILVAFGRTTNGGTGGLAIRRGANGNEIIVTKAMSTDAIITADAPGSSSTYTNIVLTYKDKALSLYINGVFANSATVEPADVIPHDNFQLGRRFGGLLNNGAVEKAGNGAIDELAAWNGTALTADQVKAFHNENYRVLKDNIALYYEFQNTDAATVGNMAWEWNSPNSTHASASATYVDSLRKDANATAYKSIVLDKGVHPGVGYAWANEFTVAAYVNLKDCKDNGTIVSIGGNLLLRKIDSDTMALCNNGDTQYVFADNDNLSNGYHLIVVKKTATSLSLQIDGGTAKECALPEGFTQPRGLQLGVRWGGGYEAYDSNGSAGVGPHLDDFLVWNVELSDDAVEALCDMYPENLIQYADDEISETGTYQLSAIVEGGLAIGPKVIATLTLAAGTTLEIDDAEVFNFLKLNIVSAGAVIIKVTDLTISQAQLNAILNTAGVAGDVTNDYTETNGYTKDNEFYPLIFRGSTTDAKWDTLTNWYTGTRTNGTDTYWIPYTKTVVPGAESLDEYRATLIDGNLMVVDAGEDDYKTVTVTSKLEGFNSKITVANKVHLTIASLKKLQGSICEWRIDDTSKITLASFDNGNNDNTPRNFYVNAKNGLALAEGTTFGASGAYYFDEDGSVQFATLNNPQTIKAVELDLGDSELTGRTIVPRKLIGFTGGNATFTEDEAVVTTNVDGMAANRVTSLQNVGDYYFEKKSEGYYVVYMAYAETVELTEFTATVDADGTTLSEALDGAVLSASAALTIDFDTTSGQIFTFDNEEVLNFSSITVTGTNGGTIALDQNCADIACEALTLNTVVSADAAFYAVNTGTIGGTGKLCLASGELTLTKENSYEGGTYIAADATLTAPTNGLGSGALTGAGKLVVNGYPAIATVRDSLGAAEWTGTYVNTANNTMEDRADWFGSVGNEGSSVEFTGVSTGYLAPAGSADFALIVSGAITFNDGSSNNGGYTFNGPLSGTGTIATTGQQSDVLQFVAENNDFRGTVTVDGYHCVAFGGQADDDSQQGKIVINQQGVTIASGKTWTAVNGITITENGTLTISEARALPTDKAVSGAGALVINGTVDLSGVTGALTCKLEVATGATVTITQAQAEAFASIEVNEGGSLKVIVAGKDIPYTANVTGEGSVNIILANGTVLSEDANYKPGLTGDCTWLEFLFEGEGDQRLSNGGTFGQAIRGEAGATWTFVDVGVTPKRQALRIHDKYPWTDTAPNFRSLETWSASFFAKMPTTEGGVLMGFGTTVGNNPGFIALVRGKGKDKVLLVSGTNAPGTNVKKSFEILADFTVPNAEEAYHLYTFVRKPSGVEIYLDGEPWMPYEQTVTVANGFQIGSLHGGFCSAGGDWKGFVYSGELTDYTGLTLTRGGSATDTNGAVDMLRIYRFALSPEDVQTLASEYTYISPSGSYSRDITENAVWFSSDSWKNDRDSTLVAEPPQGSAVTLTVSAEAPVTMTVNASEAKTFEALTLQGAEVELVGAVDSRKLSVTGLTKVICDATVDCSIIAMTGPVRVANGATLTLNVSKALLDSVVQDAVIGKYTYHLTGAAEGSIEISSLDETYNGWSVEVAQDDTKSWVLTMTRANWYVSIDADGVTTWRAGNAVETAVEVAAPEVSTNQPIYITTAYITTAGDVPVTLPSGLTSNVTVNGTGRVTLNAAANGTTIGELAINDTAMAAITPALTVNQKRVAADATLGYAAANEVWTISSALPGSTKIEIVSGTVKVTAANGGYTGQITVAEGATLASGTTATCPFGKGAIVNYGTVVLSGGQLPPTSGNGNVTIADIGSTQDDQLASIAGALTATGTLTVAANQSVRLWHHQDDFTTATPAINGPSIVLESDATIVAGDGYAETATMTIPANVTLSGSGTIDVRVILADGAIIDATNGAVTVMGTVTCPEEGKVAVIIDNYGDVLKKGGLDPMKFTVTGNSLNGQLIATSDALVYAPVIQPAEGDETAVSDAVMAEVARAAGAEEVTTVTAVVPVTIVDDEDNVVLTVDVNGVELFNNVISFEDDESVQDAKVAVINYVFGISDITVNAEGNIVVTAAVDCLMVDNPVEPIEGEDAGEGGETPAEPVKPTFVDGVVVELLNNGESIGTETVDLDNASEITITSKQTVAQIFGENVGTLDLTVKVKSAQASETPGAGEGEGTFAE